MPRYRGTPITRAHTSANATTATIHSTPFPPRRPAAVPHHVARPGDGVTGPPPGVGVRRAASDEGSAAAPGVENGRAARGPGQHLAGDLEGRDGPGGCFVPKHRGGRDEIE